MYFRYAGNVSSLPHELQTLCDNRRGLRARTIRLLFLRCPALIKQIKPPVSPRYEPYTLHGMRLLLAWHEVQLFLFTHELIWYTQTTLVFRKKAVIGTSTLNGPVQPAVWTRPRRVSCLRTLNLAAEC